MAHRNDNGILPAADRKGARTLLARHPVISVLCVYENPLFLDRLCRNLEKDGDIFVEISVSAEDAIHLMTYISFDAVVVDCAARGSPLHHVIRTIRQQGRQVPFICFSRIRDPVVESEAAELGNVVFLSFGDMPDSEAFGNLLSRIRTLARRADAGTGNDR